MCELCGSKKETQRAKIHTDGGEIIIGHYCLSCRDGRMICIGCNFLLPAHNGSCPAGDNPGRLD